MRRFALLLIAPWMALVFAGLLTVRGGAQNVPDKTQYIRKVSMTSKSLAAGILVLLIAILVMGYVAPRRAPPATRNPDVYGGWTAVQDGPAQ